MCNWLSFEVSGEMSSDLAPVPYLKDRGFFIGYF